MKSAYKSIIYKLQSLIVIRPGTGRRNIPTAEAASEFPVAASPQPVRVFLTRESLGSFTAASAAATLVGSVVHAYLIPTFSRAAVTIIAAMLIGLAQFLLSIATPDTKPRNAGEGLGLFIIALINSLQLAAAAVGMQEASVAKP
jgi:hypothetical protein